MYKHIHILFNESSCLSLFPFLPRTVLDTRQLVWVPLSPPMRVSEYDLERFSSAEDYAARSVLRPCSRPQEEAYILEQLVPSIAFRTPLVVFWGICRDSCRAVSCSLCSLRVGCPRSRSKTCFVMLEEMQLHHEQCDARWAWGDAGRCPEEVKAATVEGPAAAAADADGSSDDGEDVGEDKEEEQSQSVHKQRCIPSHSRQSMYK